MLYLQKNQWRFPEWAREKATRDYSGRAVQLDGYWSKDLEYRWGPYLRGPADDITLHQYGVCDICRSNPLNLNYTILLFMSKMQSELQ